MATTLQKKIYVCICEKMPKLEADARYQLLSSCYFLYDKWIIKK